MFSMTSKQRIAQVFGLSLLAPCAIGTSDALSSDSAMSLVSEDSTGSWTRSKTPKGKRAEILKRLQDIRSRDENQEALDKHPDYIKIRGKHSWILLDVAGIYKAEKNPDKGAEGTILYSRQPDNDVKIVRARADKNSSRCSWIMKAYYPEGMIGILHKKSGKERRSKWLYCGKATYQTVPECTLDTVQWHDKKNNIVPLRVKQISKEAAKKSRVKKHWARRNADRKQLLVERKQLLSDTRILEIKCKDNPHFDGKYQFNIHHTCIYNTYVCPENKAELTYFDGKWRLKYQGKDFPCAETADANLASLEYPYVIINGEEICAPKPEWTYYNKDSKPGVSSDAGVLVDNGSRSKKHGVNKRIPQTIYE